VLKPIAAVQTGFV